VILSIIGDTVAFGQEGSDVRAHGRSGQTASAGGMQFDLMWKNDELRLYY
jgi:hypothetical protein